MKEQNKNTESVKEKDDTEFVSQKKKAVKRKRNTPQSSTPKRKAVEASSVAVELDPLLPP